MPPPDLLGPHYFDPPLYKSGIYIDGSPLSGQIQSPISNWAQQAGFGVLKTPAGDVLQGRWFGGGIPVNLNPIDFGPLVFTVEKRNDYDRCKQAVAWGAPIAVYFDEEIIDVWHIPSRGTNQVLWRTSRRAPWHLPGISHLTRPPRAYIDSTAQTVITSGVPTAGQVMVPESGGALIDITTPVAIGAGTLLKLHYRPEFMLKPLQLSQAYQDVNSLIFTMAVEEILQGLFD